VRNNNNSMYVLYRAVCCFRTLQDYTWLPYQTAAVTMKGLFYIGHNCVTSKTFYAIGENCFLGTLHIADSQWCFVLAYSSVACFFLVASGALLYICYQLFVAQHSVVDISH